jgi:aspartyl/asparaginyl beta-hydroxylase (cupin superfamily)
MAAPRSTCQGKGMTGKEDKAERLAAALRQNLKRRKAQSRGLTAKPDGPKRD